MNKLGLCAGTVILLGAASWAGCSADDDDLFAGGGGVGDATSTSASGVTTTTSNAGGMGGAGGGPICVDEDGDGVTDCDGDCDDTNPTVYPGAPEVCGDGIDNACGTDPDPPAVCMGIGTYVSALTGNDANPGTQTSPVQTIGQGMANAVLLGNFQPVFVAEGSYPEDVVLVDDIDLLGGYACTMGNCTWQRDPATYVSTIVNQDYDGVYADHTVTRETLFEGFTVVGLGGNAGSTVYSAMLVQGAPEIRNNVVTGGDVMGCGWPCGTTALRVSGAPVDPLGALVTGNRIRGGGSTSSFTVGIQIDSGGVAEIGRNVVAGGLGGWTRAISVVPTAGAVSITNNDLYAGSCSGNASTFAIYAGQGVSPVIDSNRINADPALTGTCPGFTGNWWTGGIESEGSTAIVTNNIIFGVVSPRSTAVLLADCEGPCQVGQVVLNANTLDGRGSPGSISSISAGVVFKTWKQGQNVVVGRARNNILIGGDAGQQFAGYEDVGVQGSTCRPEFFENNDLYATTLYYQWTGMAAASHTTIAAVNTSVNGAANNISADPLLDALFHLTAGSPCIDAGTQSGGETPAWDIDGDTRPMGGAVDIGADEGG